MPKNRFSPRWKKKRGEGYYFYRRKGGGEEILFNRLFRVSISLNTGEKEKRKAHSEAQ